MVVDTLRRTCVTFRTSLNLCVSCQEGHPHFLFVMSRSCAPLLDVSLPVPFALQTPSLPHHSLREQQPCNPRHGGRLAELNTYMCRCGCFLVCVPGSLGGEIAPPSGCARDGSSLKTQVVPMKVTEDRQMHRWSSVPRSISAKGRVSPNPSSSQWPPASTSASETCTT